MAIGKLVIDGQKNETLVPYLLTCMKTNSKETSGHIER